LRQLHFIILQERADVDGTGRFQTLREVQTACFILVVADAQENPTTSPVNSDEGITSGCFIQHPEQILHVDMDEPRRVFLDTLLSNRRIRLFLPGASRVFGMVCARQ
jgi:hypothetical protein